MPNLLAILAFGTPSRARLLINAQSSKVITLQSSKSAHFSSAVPAQFSSAADSVGGDETSVLRLTVEQVSKVCRNCPAADMRPAR